MKKCAVILYLSVLVIDCYSRGFGGIQDRFDLINPADKLVYTPPNNYITTGVKLEDFVRVQMRVDHSKVQNKSTTIVWKGRRSKYDIFQ